jgi:hypothetical protein
MISNKVDRDSLLAYLEANNLSYEHYKKGEEGKVLKSESKPSEVIETAQISIESKDALCALLGQEAHFDKLFFWESIEKYFPELIKKPTKKTKKTK